MENFQSQDNKIRNAWIKVIGGLILSVVSVLGLVKGRKVKHRGLRVSLLAICVVGLAVGGYHLVEGTGELCVLGVLGVDIPGICALGSIKLGP